MHSALRERRVAASRTQVALAREAGVSRAQISAIEGGRHVPSVTTALALARALDVPLEELFPSPPVEAVPVAEPAAEGAPLRLGRVGDRLVYAALPDRGAGAALFRAPDAVLRHGLVQILPGSETQGVVITGCDPSLGLMADLLPTRGHRPCPSMPRPRTPAEPSGQGAATRRSSTDGRSTCAVDPRTRSATRSRAGAWASRPRRRECSASELWGMGRCGSPSATRVPRPRRPCCGPCAGRERICA